MQDTESKIQDAAFLVEEFVHVSVTCINRVYALETISFQLILISHTPSPFFLFQQNQFYWFSLFCSVAAINVTYQCIYMDKTVNTKIKLAKVCLALIIRGMI